MSYLWAFLIVFAENLMPAFGPPTWLVLVYLTLGFDLEPIPLIILSVIAASIAHYILAYAFRRFRFVLPDWYRHNLENLGDKITKHGATSWGLFVLFLWSPLSSSQLFVAAGLIRQVKILPLVAAFAVGRSITYPTYIYGATLLAHTDLGRTFVSEMTSPFALIGQTLLIVAVIALGFIKWKTQSSDSPEDRL
ncbi:MAG: hypothetical protein ACO3P3_05600 [Candidatus Nanopelagicales bacterium]